MTSTQNSVIDVREIAPRERHALIFGSDELAQGSVMLKNLRDGNSGQQTLQPLSDIVTLAKRLQSDKSEQ